VASPLAEAGTLTQLFEARVAATPDAPAYRRFRDDRWESFSWAQAAREVARWQAALRREGLKPGERVALCLRNRFEWMCFDQAALGLGLVVVPLYFNDRPDNMAYCLGEAGARLLLLEDPAIWPELRDLAPDLVRVVTLARYERDDAKVVHVDHWLPAEGGGFDAGPAGPDDLATLVFTSGTTGRPKGVMLSHANMLSNARAALAACPLVNAHDRFLSFLPLSHMFERTVGYYLPMVAGAEVAYARGITELGEDMLSQRPTVLVCVPRIFERIYVKMLEKLPPGSFKRRLFDKAVEVGWRRFKQEARGGDALLWPILKFLVARKLHARLGGRIRVIVTGAAALAPPLARTFLGLGLPIIQGYGLTEFSPVVSVNRLDANDPASVGYPLEGVEVRLGEDGELLVRGPGRMLGYWNNKEATDAMIDADGWLHTGDKARIEAGRIFISGRAKEIIVLSNGEKVPPGDAEQAILMDPAFEQVMVVGEGRGHLGLLVVSPIDDEQELCRRANAALNGFPGYAKIHHLARVPEPWTVENELLTPTLKPRRNKIEERYAGLIDTMYRRENTCRGL
jgi:long-chain acyl-CoA synthetase